MYKKNTQCNKCEHYDTENHRCDAFCSFMKETCDDVYQQGREDMFEELKPKADSQAYQQGREDAIDEFTNALINDGKVSAMRVLKIKEQLKEQ